MFKNYLKIALRNLSRYKGYSLINILGLAIGMTCTILILMWVRDELNYDRFHENREQIFRVVFADETYADIRHYSVTPPALAGVLKSDYPEIIEAIRYWSQEKTLLAAGEKKVKTTAGFTDPEIFRIFSLPFLKGDPTTALENPNSVVLTTDLADRIFDGNEPVGRMITLDNHTVFTVTGIIQKLPANSTLNFDLLVPFQSLKEISAALRIEDWDEFAYQTYVLMNHRTDIAEFNRKISNLLTAVHDFDWKPRLYLQPLTDIHVRDLNGGGPITYIYIFSIIAAFLLFIACINFMNLTTARSVFRGKEIGIRKVVGASKWRLIHQFYFESVLMAILSFVVSLLMVELFLPVFNDLSGKTLSLNITSDFRLLIILAGITLITGVISGSYPALFLSALRPLNILKGITARASSRFRKMLVVFQFTLSIILIIATLGVSHQLSYLREQDLGFDMEHIIYLPLNRDLQADFETFRNSLLQHPQIRSITATSSQPGVGNVASTDLNEWEGHDGDKALLLYMLAADYDFLQTFNIELFSGRYFSREFVSDSGGVVLNQTAVREMGMTDPIGKKIFSENRRIIGVIKDFNFKSLRQRIQPLGIFLAPQWFEYAAVKIKGNDIPATLRYLETVHQKFSPRYPFEYQFLDEAFDRLYRSEQQLGTIFKYFSLLAIFISCLGLFGLTAFTIERRVKEIGIRKAIGATVPNIVSLIINEFLKWVMMANLLAWPVAGYILNRWLQNFAYRAGLSWWIFALAGSLTIVIALLTVSWQAIRAARTNPVDALRYE